jgi:hypothetical protein
MPRPGYVRGHSAADITLFTDRDHLRGRIGALTHAVTELPVVMFYGVGGAGKSWLLRKLREEVSRDLPVAFLDFGAMGGQQFVLDPSSALQQIRHQLGAAAPRFDLALGMMRFKQDLGKEPSTYGEGIGIAVELASEIASKARELIPGAQIPGAKVLLDRLSKSLRHRIQDLPIGEFISTQLGSEFALQLRSRTSQEIGDELLNYLAEDMDANLPVHFHRAARAVIFLDTYEAVSSGIQNRAQRLLREKWIRDLAGNFDIALTVIAGQNKLTWEESDMVWADCLEQHAVGGLAEPDARYFLALSGIKDTSLQTAVLRTAHDLSDGGNHCFSLGLCADIVAAERRSGHEPRAETLSLRPHDWRALADRFLKSLYSDAERSWIQQLALTPFFDEFAARSAYSREPSAAQDAAWDALPGYSFVDPVTGRPGWFTVRAQMRWALENQAGAPDRASRNHQLWRDVWSRASKTPFDDQAALAWYHGYCLEPREALSRWNKLAESTRTAMPPRMREHFELLRWWEPVDLLRHPPLTLNDADALSSNGGELWQASLGNREANLRQAITCYEAALHVYTETDFPREHELVAENLNLITSIP